ncbi:hypothetical protein [Bacillus sp. OV166]|nr:hypothetical protein [Bacillus sp. OV166]
MLINPPTSIVLSITVHTYRMQEHSSGKLVAWWWQNPTSCHQFNLP